MRVGMKAPLMALAAACVLSFSLTPALARDLRVGMPIETTSIDPAAMVVPYNASISLHLYDGLIRRAPDMALQPGLATAWKAVDDTTWEFTLRPGVKWHDGSDFTAADVIATIERIKALDVPVSFRLYTSTITAMEAPEPLKLVVRTNGPDPVLPGKLSFLFIIPAKFKDAPSADFNSGKAAIGTGPYKFGEYVQGQRVVVQKFDGYWDKPAPFDRIVFRTVPNDAARVAGILANDVDAILDVPPGDVPQLKRNSALTVTVGPQDRVISFYSNFGATTKFVRGSDGKPLAENPFRDLRVRQAVSRAIDREAILDKVLEGLGETASQIFPSTYAGASPRLKVEAYDPAGAKKLLADAGFPNGFGLTMQCTAGRFLRDREVCETVAAMLSQIGIQVEVEALPFAVHTQRRLTRELNFYMYSGGTGWGEILNTFLAVAPTPNPQLRVGSANSNNYSNPEVDKLLLDATKTIDDQARWGMEAQAMDIYVGKDAAAAPVYRQATIVATRKGLRYATREDGMFNALHMSVEAK